MFSFGPARPLRGGPMAHPMAHPMCRLVVAHPGLKRQVNISALRRYEERPQPRPARWDTPPCGEDAFSLRSDKRKFGVLAETGVRALPGRPVWPRNGIAGTIILRFRHQNQKREADTLSVASRRVANPSLPFSPLPLPGITEYCLSPRESGVEQKESCDHHVTRSILIGWTPAGHPGRALSIGQH